MTDIQVPVTRNLEDLWSDIFGGGWEDSPWWVHLTYENGGDWDKPSPVTIKHWGKEDDNVIEVTKLTVDDVVKAYTKLLNENFTHCGNYPLDDADACTSDVILQTAVFGEVVYG